MYDSMTGEGGLFKKVLFRKDGLHLSNPGNRKLVKEWVRVIKSNMEDTVNQVGDKETWTWNFNKESMIITGDLETHEVDCLIDTGSFVSIISEEMFSRLKEARKEESYLTDVCGLGDVRQTVLGLTSVTIKFGLEELRVECHIVERLRYDVLIGRDTLDKVLRTMNYQDGTLVFQQPSGELTRKKGHVSSLVLGSYELPPHSVTEIQMQCAEITGQCIISGRKEWVKKGVVIQRDNRTVGERQTFACRVQNVTDKVINILDKQCLVDTEVKSAVTGQVWMANKGFPDQARPPNSDETMRLIREKEIGVREPTELVQEVRNILIENSEAFASSDRELKHLKGVASSDEQEENKEERRTEIVKQRIDKDLRCERAPSDSSDECINQDGSTEMGSQSRKQQILTHRYRKRHRQLFICITLFIINMMCQVQTINAIRKPALGDIYDCEYSCKEINYAISSQLARAFAILLCLWLIRIWDTHIGARHLRELNVLEYNLKRTLQDHHRNDDNFIIPPFE